MDKDRDLLERILNDTAECKKMVPLGFVSHIFLGVMSQMIEDKDGIFDKIAHAIGEEGGRAVTCLVKSITGSFLGSLLTSTLCQSEKDAINLAKKYGISEDQVKIEKDEIEGAEEHQA